MPELHSKQPGFTYSSSGLFPKHRKIIQTFRETGHLKHLYRNEIDKAHDVVYSDSKDLAKATISDKILKDTAYEIVRTSKYDAYKRALASMVYKIFDKKPGSRLSENEQLIEELHKPVIKKLIINSVKIFLKNLTSIHQL